jgi:hypothetical protein
MEVISQLYVPGPQCSAEESTPFSHRIGGLVGARASLTALEEQKQLFQCWELNCDSLVVHMTSVTQYKLLYTPHLGRKWTEGTRNF